MSKLHVSISAEPIFNLGSFEVTNSMATGAVVSILLIIFAFNASKKFKMTRTPKGVQNIVEMAFEGLLNLMIGIAGNKKAREFFPVVATLFIYILFSNWTGLLPGVGTIGIKRGVEVVAHNEEQIADSTLEETIVDEDRGIIAEDVELKNEKQQSSVDNAESHETISGSENTEVENIHKSNSSEESFEQSESFGNETSFVPLIRPPSADLNSTIALALFSVIGAQVIGFKYLKLGYLKKFLDFSGPMQFFIGILEIISELSRILSYAFRLFGNIFAGEVLLSVMLFLLPFLAPLPFIGLEIFVGLIQALVFAILTLVFWNMATLAHDEH